MNAVPKELFVNCKYKVGQIKTQMPPDCTKVQLALLNKQ